jgi:ribonucleotide monophosphatase NagD (HAD superfamily)
MKQTRSILVVVLAILAASTLWANHPWLTRVYEYRPAPGQFINTMPVCRVGEPVDSVLARCQAAICGYIDTVTTTFHGQTITRIDTVWAESMISLGGYGGYVIVGFDQTLTYENLTIACRLIDRGVPYIATHPDVRCPIEGGEYIPDTGAFLACIKTATGKEPECITGKPYGYMVDTVLERTGLQKEEIAMVGDRLMTDIRFGKDNGILSVLVLTGEATLEDVEKGTVKPDIILPHAKEILKYL